MARPRKNKDEKKSEQINFWLSGDAKAMIARQAENSGLTINDWIRKSLLTGKFPKAKVSVIDEKTFRELHSIGINLNQAIKLANMGKLPSTNLNSTLQELKVLLFELKSKIV